MTAAAIRLVELDTDASVIEAAAKRVHLALLQGSAIALCGVGCIYFGRANRKARKLRTKLSSTSVSSTEDRAMMRDIALNLNEAAKALDSAAQELAHHKVVTILFGSKLLTQVEDLACAIEDMAETAALAGSESFARSVTHDLRIALDEHHRITA